MGRKSGIRANGNVGRAAENDPILANLIEPDEKTFYYSYWNQTGKATFTGVNAAVGGGYKALTDPIGKSVDMPIVTGIQHKPEGNCWIDQMIDDFRGLQRKKYPGRFSIDVPDDKIPHPKKLIIKGPLQRW